MREIKFRAWDKDKKFFIYFKLPNFNGSWDINLLDKEIQQFTGLKDKNNKDIYEGDIVRYACGISRNSTGYIENDIYKYQYTIQRVVNGKQSTDYFGWNSEDINFDTLEVIGNIYENPELLN